MQNNFFINKNILFLFPIDRNQFLDFFYGAFKKYNKNVYCLNFVDYSHQNGIRNTERYIKNLIFDKNIDLIFTIPFATDYQLSVEFYISLKNKTKIVFWMFDDDMYFDAYSKHYCQIANAVVTNDYHSIFNYEKLGIPAIQILPIRSKNNYYPVETAKDIDVSFAGDCTKNDRMKYINFLINKGINVETFGKGSKNGYVKWEELPKIFSRSKISLNFSKIDNLSWINRDDPLLNRIKQTKGHPVEIALTKSFCLTENSPGLNILFEVGKEIDVFYNKEELLEKVKYYLANDDKREEIAQNAYIGTMENYEAEIYMPQLLRNLEEILEKPNKTKPEKIEIYLSRAFKINSINGLTFSMFVLIKNRKIFYALELFKELSKYGFFVFIQGFYGGLVRVTKNIYDKIAKN